jgi:hypothetical protein
VARKAKADQNRNAKLARKGQAAKAATLGRVMGAKEVAKGQAAKAAALGRIPVMGAKEVGKGQAAKAAALGRISVMGAKEVAKVNVAAAKAAALGRAKSYVLTSRTAAHAAEAVRAHMRTSRVQETLRSEVRGESMVVWAAAVALAE